MGFELRLLPGRGTRDHLSLDVAHFCSANFPPEEGCPVLFLLFSDTWNFQLTQQVGFFIETQPAKAPTFTDL